MWWGELSSDCGASCLLNVVRVFLGRVFFGASCLGASCHWGELSVILKYIYTMDEIKLESVTDQKDSNSLKPKTHIEIVTKKAYQKIGMIRRCFTNFTPVKITTLNKPIIRPGLEYTSPKWNP